MRMRNLICICNIGGINLSISSESINNVKKYIDGEGITLGDFKKQTKEGYGMEYMFTEEIYIGNYKKSHRHGKGTYMFLDGTTQEVKYKDGNLQ